MINGKDNLSKNILWVTYDGETWTPSAYDLDSTWGIYCDGTIFDESQWLSLKQFSGAKNTNLLWKKMLSVFKSEIKERYFELRSSVLSTDNITKSFSDFVGLIPTKAYKFDTLLYKNIPSQKTSNLAQISYFAHTNLSRLDKEFSVL